MPELKAPSLKTNDNVQTNAGIKSNVMFISDNISWQAKFLNKVLLKHVVKPQIAKVTKNGLNVKAFRVAAKMFDKLASCHKPKPKHLDEHKQPTNSISELSLSNQENEQLFSTINVANVPCSYLQTTTSKRVMLYLHGGGFCIHLPKTYDNFVYKLADSLNASAFIPNYRLAPEHPFPASIDDCLNVYKELLKRGYKAENITIAGDSAGGNLALTTLIQIRDQKLAQPAAAILMSPATDVSEMGFKLMADNEDQDPLFSQQALRSLTENYTAFDVSVENKLVSPLFDSLQGLAPLQFHVGSTELLLNNSVRANDKATQATTESQIVIWKEMPHVHPLFTWLPESKRAMSMMVSFANKHLAKQA